MDVPSFVYISSVGLLGLFPLFYIMNDAAMDICLQVFVWNVFSFLLHVHLGVEFLGPMVTPYLTF